LLLNARRPDEAERVLQDGLRSNVRQPGFAMALARLQVERGDVGAGIETLQKSAAAAGANADYLAFLAALLQRQERHAEAVEHYHAALSLAPTAAVWQMGLGISLQALNRTAEAQDAFRRARSGSGLNPELQAFVDDRLRQLARR
jgi:MSHA biogenesis protein MshN